MSWSCVGLAGGDLSWPIRGVVQIDTAAHGMTASFGVPAASMAVAPAHAVRHAREDFLNGRFPEG
ncbi:hypothetical protein ACYT84_14670 [Ralstonia solanacearum]|uniref:hypothetical protein n=1 Tax=Ralstonia solanacearum TaxID=305 RepID=UPI00168B9A19|nr:hypothetical protein [Ralstonia solanacearum]QNT25669.1 hypothetical protein C2I38_26805 [Ralstonia solanacearum]QNT63282.1 hypothetical protein C2L97_26665 [Ralstonia solanacearum]